MKKIKHRNRAGLIVYVQTYLKMQGIEASMVEIEDIIIGIDKKLEYSNSKIRLDVMADALFAGGVLDVIEREESG